MIDYLSLKKITAQHGDEIKTVVSRVIDSGWYLKGEATKRFEAQYASYIGSRFCIGCGNGLDALTLIFRAYLEMGVLQRGDEVIVPGNAYIASILSITENGLTPVLVEPRADSLEIDDTLIEQAITPRVKAILLVHMYGRCAMTSHIADLCKQYHLLLIEDNAQSVGCLWDDAQQSSSMKDEKASIELPYNNKGVTVCRTGSLGDASAHSFYPGKNLGALGDAGAVTTNDPELADLVRALGNYGSSKKYVFPYKGRNSRIDELQAAVLSAKLKYVDKENARRRTIASYYYSQLDIAGLSLPGKDAWCASGQNDLACNYHIFPILCVHRDQLQQALADKGIGTMIHYPIPPHWQACYKQWNNLALPVTERIHREELSLPCNQVMTDEEVCQVVEEVQRFMRRQ